MNVIQEIEKSFMREGLPDFRAGDTVAVHYKIKEGERERIQVFEGVVIAMKGGSSRETFTVRKVTYGVGVERIFPLHSPLIDKIVVKRLGKVRRAKLYYLRGLSKKASRIKERSRLGHINPGKKAAAAVATEAPAAEPEAAGAQVQQAQVQASEETAVQVPEQAAVVETEAPDKVVEDTKASEPEGAVETRPEAAETVDAGPAQDEQGGDKKS